MSASIEQTSRVVMFTLADAEPVEGSTGSLRLRTVRPSRGEVLIQHGKIASISVWGVQVKSDGSETMVQFEVKFGIDSDFRPPPPAWLLDLVLTVV